MRKNEYVSTDIMIQMLIFLYMVEPYYNIVKHIDQELHDSWKYPNKTYVNKLVMKE